MPLKNQSAVKNILDFDRTFLFLLLFVHYSRLMNNNRAWSYTQLKIKV